MISKSRKIESSASRTRCKKIPRKLRSQRTVSNHLQLVKAYRDFLFGLRAYGTRKTRSLTKGQFPTRPDCSADMPSASAIVVE